MVVSSKRTSLVLGRPHLLHCSGCVTRCTLARVCVELGLVGDEVLHCEAMILPCFLWFRWPDRARPQTMILSPQTIFILLFPRPIYKNETFGNYLDYKVYVLDRPTVALLLRLFLVHV